jgi:hypothetical protein
MLKAIHAQESREAADNKAQAIIGDLRASDRTSCRSALANQVRLVFHSKHPA